MGRLAVLGERSRVAGYALAGAEVLVADDASAVRSAWQALTEDPAGPVDVLVLTRRAADALPGDIGDRDHPLVVVMPP